jgi:acetyl-CoA synthetase
MGKSVEFVTAVLGIWRRGAVHVPLFTAFAAPAIEMRLQASGAKAVVVDAATSARSLATLSRPARSSPAAVR